RHSVSGPTSGWTPLPGVLAGRAGRVAGTGCARARSGSVAVRVHRPPALTCVRLFVRGKSSPGMRAIAESGTICYSRALRKLVRTVGRGRSVLLVAGARDASRPAQKAWSGSPPAARHSGVAGVELVGGVAEGVVD